MKTYKFSGVALLSLLAVTTFADVALAEVIPIDLVVISGKKSVGELIGEGGGLPPPPVLPEPPIMVEVKSVGEKIEDVVKKVKKACRPSTESCADWGARMIAPLVLDSNGIPTGTGMGICVGSMAAANVCKLTIIELTDNPQFCASIKCPEA